MLLKLNKNFKVIPSYKLIIPIFEKYFIDY